MAKSNEYAATLKVDYPKKLDRTSSFFRLLWAIPILIVITVLTTSGETTYVTESGKVVTESGSGIVGGLFVATALMLVFRQRYPKWWFSFSLELNRFSARVGAYVFLLTDQYPSTEDEQSVHLDIKYPDAKKLNSFLPLFKWLLAFPHYIVLSFLAVGVVFSTIIAWFSILFTGTYPKSLFDFVVGFGRWALRVNAYAFLLVTDEYPPFSLS